MIHIVSNPTEIRNILSQEIKEFLGPKIIKDIETRIDHQLNRTLKSLAQSINQRPYKPNYAYDFVVKWDRYLNTGCGWMIPDPKFTIRILIKNLSAFPLIKEELLK